MYFCHLIMEIYLNIGHFDFLANVRMLKFGTELRYGIRSPNVRTPVDIPILYSKTGVCKGIPIFLIFAPNIDCGYSLEPPRRGGSNLYPQSMF